jgi:general secretion pathway protein E
MAIGTDLPHSTTLPADRAADVPAPAPQYPDYELAERFGDYLAQEAVLDGSALDRARRAAQSTGERLDRVLTKLGLISEPDLAAALSRYLTIPLAVPGEVPREPVAANIVEANFVRRSGIMPLAIATDRIVVGVVDPLNDEPLQALAYMTNLKVDPRLFAAADFDKAFESLYAASPGDTSASTIDASEASDVDVQRLRDMASEAPTIRLVNQIIAGAVEARASDIHVEPSIDALLVRYRIDGALRTAHTLSPGLRAAITSRIKIISKLDIAERRLPQDGRTRIAVRGIDIDIRVSTIATAYGESVVMRLLDRSRVELDFAKLGFNATQVATLGQLANQPNGIILVTGPTGSGKTTTLYTALKGLNSNDRKIFTVEDPIEYQLVGINQVQVQPGIGLTFPHALRSILRQDPDIVMIGEIRDLETARIAIQASLTGHLVLSTLHTNSAAAAITRLVDMGIESYLIASTVKGIVAQRLVRKLCPHCASRHDNVEQWAKTLSRECPVIEGSGAPDIRQARGCAECGGTGFSGRTTIAEMLIVDPDLHRLILANASDSEIERSARERGMMRMADTGAEKVWRGETTIDEVLRATRLG